MPIQQRRSPRHQFAPTSSNSCPARRRSATSALRSGSSGASSGPRTAHTCRPSFMRPRKTGPKAVCRQGFSPYRAIPGHLRPTPDCANRTVSSAASAQPATAASVSVRTWSARSAPIRDSSGTLFNWKSTVSLTSPCCGHRAACRRPRWRRPPVSRREADGRREPHQARCRADAAAIRRVRPARPHVRRWRIHVSVSAGRRSSRRRSARQ